MFSLLRELIFPDKCVGCGTWGRAVCEECLSKIGGFKLYGKAYAFGIYEGVLRDIILNAKYKGYGRPIVELISFYKDDLLFLKKDIDLVVPVPEDPLRRKTFSHVALFAKELALRLGKNVSFSLFKVRPTPPQVTLKKVERERNLKGAFYFNGELRGMRVLLVDDVLTTGTTLEECSGALLKAGALKIVKLVIAVSL